ncbi:MAG: hypothetical protein GY847_36330 [Proteobacteria bacterium]|nr:hypothetical protein [Pseudomonadota bacterium]
MKKITRPLNLESVTTHRREECVHYEGCLEEASALLWPSFSCDGCKLFMAKSGEPMCYERAASPLAWEV